MSNPTTPVPDPQITPAPTDEELKKDAAEFLASAFPVDPPRKDIMDEVAAISALPTPDPAPEPAPEPPAELPAATPPVVPAAEPPPSPPTPPVVAAAPPVAPPAEPARKPVNEADFVPADTTPALGQPAPTLIEPSLELAPEHQQMLRNMEILQANDPRYTGIVGKLKAFWKAEEALITKWMAEHPDETFDEDAPEHARFYEKNQPAVDPGHLEVAKEKALREQITSDVRKEVVEKEVRPVLNQIAARDREERAQSAIIESRVTGITEFATQIPEIKDILTVDGQVVVNNATTEKLKKEKPDEYAVLDPIAQQLTAELTELAKLDSGVKVGLDVTQSIIIDGRRVFPDAELVDAFKAVETRFSKESESKSVRDGKKFITSEEQARIVERINGSRATSDQKEASLRNLSEKTWTVSAADVRQHLISKHAQEATKRLGFINGVVDRRVASRVTVPSTSGNQPVPAAPTGAPAAGHRTNPPSTASASDRSATILPGQGEDAKENERWIKSAMGM